VGSFGRAALRLDQELFEYTAHRRSPLLDRALPRLTRAADHGVLWMAVAGGLALTGGARGRRAARAGLVAVAVASAIAMTVPAAAVPVGVLATGVAYSRVHTGVHYPGDVAAGILLGAAVGLLLGRRARRSGLPPCRRQGRQRLR
jgi:membrane-associated phospholipid phosphatase